MRCIFQGLLGGISTELKAFRRQEDGSLIIFSLFVFVMMLIISGLAVDFMRVEAKRTQIQGTLDRAVLAGASLEQALDSETVVRDYFERAGLTEYLRDVDVTEGRTSKTISAIAQAEVQPYFLQMLGFGDLPAYASGTALEGFTDIEISLVLDVSGSMGWTSTGSGNIKIEDLKDAAQEFVYRVQCNPDTDNIFVDPCTIDANTVSINLIMYNDQVLVGEDLLTRFNVTNEHNFSSCVDFEHADYFDTAITISQPLKRAGHFDAYSWWWKGYADYELAREPNRTCVPEPNNEIMPLEEDWQTLFNRIEALNAAGGTSIEMGMKWGSALLDPAFRPISVQLAAEHALTGGASGVIPQFAIRPVSFTNPNIQKFVVLMTDGENTWHYELKDEFRSGPSEVWLDTGADPDDTSDDIISIYRESQDKYINPMTGGQRDSSPFGTNPRQLDYVEVWERYNTDFYSNGRNNGGAHNWLPNPVNETNAAGKNADLVAICKEASLQNVTIYTVGFETSTDSTAVMKKCASSHDHHFDVDGSNIDDAFAAIARNIVKLKLVN